MTDEFTGGMGVKVMTFYWLSNASFHPLIANVSVTSWYHKTWIGVRTMPNVKISIFLTWVQPDPKNNTLKVKRLPWQFCPKPMVAVERRVDSEYMPFRFRTVQFQVF